MSGPTVEGEQGSEQPSLDDLFKRINALPILPRTRLLLELIADDIPEPSSGQTEPALLMALLAQRAKSLYANFLHSLGSPAEIGPLLAVRPLGELVILIKWLTLDLDLHPFLYFADSEGAEISHLDAVRAHARDRGTAVPDDPTDPTQKEAVRDAALARLRSLNKNYGKDRIMPNLRRMADEVISRVPGHKLVMNDAYVYAYKTFSGWEHSDAGSFKATAEEFSPGEWRWIGDRSPWAADIVEVIGSAFYAYVLETAFATIGDAKGAGIARGVRDKLMDEFGRPGEPEMIDREAPEE